MDWINSEIRPSLIDVFMGETNVLLGWVKIVLYWFEFFDLEYVSWEISLFKIILVGKCEEEFTDF